MWSYKLFDVDKQVFDVVKNDSNLFRYKNKMLRLEA